MDPRNGEVMAMGSYPSFDPNIFAKPLKQSTFDKLNSEENGAPLIDRAIVGLYPTGLDDEGHHRRGCAGVRRGHGGGSRSTTRGSIQIGDVLFKNAGETPHGTVIAAHGAAGLLRRLLLHHGHAHELGRGHAPPALGAAAGDGTVRPASTCPGETDGLVPNPAWRNRLFARELTDRPWSVGDNVNFAVGQGDLQATPLQMAVAYSAIANDDGNVPTPHIGLQVEDAAGRLLQEIDPPPARRVKHRRRPPRGRASRACAWRRRTPPGTSADVFAGFPHTVLRQDGHGRATRPGRPVLVRGLRDRRRREAVRSWWP